MEHAEHAIDPEMVGWNRIMSNEGSGIGTPKRYEIWQHRYTAEEAATDEGWTVNWFDDAEWNWIAFAFGGVGENEARVTWSTRLEAASATEADAWGYYGDALYDFAVLDPQRGRRLDRRPVARFHRSPCPVVDGVPRRHARLRHHHRSRSDAGRGDDHLPDPRARSEPTPGGRPPSGRRPVGHHRARSWLLDKAQGAGDGWGGDIYFNWSTNGTTAQPPRRVALNYDLIGGFSAGAPPCRSTGAANGSWCRRGSATTSGRRSRSSRTCSSRVPPRRTRSTRRPR